MFKGKIFFVVKFSSSGVGMVDEVMIYAAFCYENNEGGSEGDLWFIRNTSGRENNDDCDEVEKVVINQGCDLK